MKVGNWQQTQRLQSPSVGTFDLYGGSIALSGDGQVLAVGAPSENSGGTGVDSDPYNNARSSSGGIFIYSQVDGQWQWQTLLKADNPTALDNFGTGLALNQDGTLLVTSARGEDGGGRGY